MLEQVVRNFVSAWTRTGVESLGVSVLEGVANVDQELARLVYRLVAIRGVLVRNRWRTLLDHKFFAAAVVENHLFGPNSASNALIDHRICLDRDLPHLVVVS